MFRDGCHCGIEEADCYFKVAKADCKASFDHIHLISLGAISRRCEAFGPVELSQSRPDPSHAQE